MNSALENLLTQLERISSEAVRATDPALADQEDDALSAELIRERGLLIGQLTEALTAATEPLGYVEGNRLIVIHRQGTQIEQNVAMRRNEITAQLARATSGRAFLECVSAIIGNPSSPQIDTSV